MTAKNRHKSSSSGEKSAAAAASSHEDASKKSPKSSTGNGVAVPEAPGQKSGSCLGLLATVLFYAALIGAAGFAAFYMQQVVEEIRETSARHEESAQRSAELSGKMESVVQQVGRKYWESMEGKWGNELGIHCKTFSRVKHTLHTLYMSCVAVFVRHYITVRIVVVLDVLVMGVGSVW